MLEHPDALIADFSEAADQLGIDGWPCGWPVSFCPRRTASLDYESASGPSTPLPSAGALPPQLAWGWSSKSAGQDQTATRASDHSITRPPDARPWPRAC
jgi:hypothetical protein